MSVPLDGGLTVADTAARLAGVRDALKRKVAAAARRLPDEPRLEVKAALAQHLYDDARSAIKLDRRVGELGEPAAPAPVDDVVAGAQALLEAIDPLVDEPTLRVLTQLLHRQRRHADELDPRTHDQRERVPEVDLPAASVTYIDAAERAARAMAERHDAPWEFHADMARIASDSMRHAIVMQRLPGEPGPVVEHVRADEAAHARMRARWGL